LRVQKEMTHRILIPKMARGYPLLGSKACGTLARDDAGLLNRASVAQGGQDEDCGEAGFDEEFAAVEEVYRGIFQGGVGEEAVPEERGGGDVDGEVKGFPEAAAEADAEIGRDDDDGDYVEGYGADGVFEGLAGGVDGVEEIADAELRGFVEEENDGMDDGKGEGDVAGEVVQAEIVEVAVRPLADGAVAESHQGAEEHVEGDGSYGG